MILEWVIADDDFNPLPSCEGRPLSPSVCTPSVNFNPLPSCEGRLWMPSWMDVPSSFQSTPLMRGETDELPDDIRVQVISIHSPHARGDIKSRKRQGGKNDFNPLPSCEGRHAEHPNSGQSFLFQSTPLMRGETKFISATIY